MRLSHQVALASLSKTVKHVSVFALSIILARSLSTESYGLYLQVQLVVSTLLYLAIFGVPHSIYYFLPRTRQPKLLISASALALAVVGLLLAALVHAGIDTIAEWLSNPDLVGLAAVMAGLLFFQVPIKLFEPAMIAAKRVGMFVLLNSTFNFLFFFPIAVPAMLGWPVDDILRAMLAFYVVQFAAMMLTLLFVTRGLTGQADGETYSFKAQVVYSAPIGLSGMVGEIGRQNDKIIVGGLFDPAQYALYTRGAMEIPLLNVISNSLHNVMMPKFVEAYRDGNKEELLRSWHSAMRLMASFIYPACAFFIATGDLLIPFLYSDRFAEASIIFQIYMFSLLVRITTGDAIIRAIGRTGVLLKISLATIVLNVVLTVGLIHLMGITGAPTATVLASYIMTTVYVYIVAGMLGVRPGQIFPWRSLGTILLASAISIAAASTLRVLDLERPAMLGAIFLAFACIYPLVFRLAGVLDSRERDAVRSLIPPGLRWVA
jgi:O-antigen/teichoic acid export membrane protein